MAVRTSSSVAASLSGAIGEPSTIRLFPGGIADVQRIAMHELNLRASARELVMTYGWNTTAYQILNPGLQYWFAPEASAVVAYTQRQNVLLVAGAPVCAAGALPRIVAEFECFADQQGCRVCYVCAADRLHDLISSSRQHSTIVIGAQPVWNPQTWAALVVSRRSLRTQLARARNKGVMIEAMSSALGGDNPELDRVLDEWLSARGLPPLHFLVEPRTLRGVVADRVLLVARRAGSVVAFLVASPVVARNGYLIEQVARSPRAPNGASELLIDAAMRRFAAAGKSYTTLGLVALSSQAANARALNPWWLRIMMTFARAHATRCYNFRGLERFRTKMSPSHWETIYAISNERSFSLRTPMRWARRLGNLAVARAGPRPRAGGAPGSAHDHGRNVSA